MSKAAKIVIGIIVIALLIGIGWTLFATQLEETNQVTNEPQQTLETEAETPPPPAPPAEESEDAETGTQAETATVTYTDSGFQPGSLSVPVGTTVTFTNESSDTMWVASDVHPTHTEYSGASRVEHCSGGSSAAAFDQCQVGQTYSFTFNKPGTWGYHNHQMSFHTGTITVTE